MILSAGHIFNLIFMFKSKITTMHHNLQTLKKVCILLLLASLPGLILAQELASTDGSIAVKVIQDTKKNMVPLVEILEDMEVRYQVHFNYNSELLEDKMVEKKALENQKEFENALKILLTPLNLRFEKFEKEKIII